MVEGKAKLRLFVGVRISVGAAEGIARAAEKMREAARDEGIVARWVAPTSYHITLKFLGWTHAPLVGALNDEIGAALAGASSFELETAGLGAFPDPERARVLWAGARDPDARLADLAARVEAAAARLGFAGESRGFHPHVTLARLRRPADATKILERQPEHEFRKSRIDSVVLFESEMKSNGSGYASRAVWPLDRAGSALGRQT